MQKIVYEEGICRNCAGTSLYLRNLFFYMGEHYRNTQEEISLDELMELIQWGHYISLNSQSLYNFVDRYDAPSLRKKIQSLCENPTPYPLVFLLAEPISRKIGKVQYVVCDGEELGIQVFKMTDEAEVVISSNP